MREDLMKRGRIVWWFPIFWLVSFFLHLAWENWQIPFFAGMAEAPHAKAVWFCTKAAFGDANIALVAYLLAVGWRRSWHWPLAPKGGTVVVYLFTGLAVTVVLEYLATEQWSRWSYSSRMLVIPVLNTGLLPVLQWSLLPPVYLFVARWLYLGLSSDPAVKPDDRLRHDQPDVAPAEQKERR